ncbi:MAG: glycosyltransferase family 2 protein [bacterium]|nr:glycosyltransferase family 2 protein [bacterium]
MGTQKSIVPELSVVIPVYNEQGNLSVLDKELKTALQGLRRSYEILYVNDGSTDDSLGELKALSGITIIELNRNYGQATALDAGFKAAEGDIVISLDADGQNDPADISALLKKLEGEKLDVVAGWRKKRNDNGNIRVITIAARLLRRLFIGDIVHDSGCTLRVYRREAVKSLDIGGEMHRFILALLKWKGFKIGEMVVNHRPRTIGVSKYGSSKALRGTIDLIYIWFIHKYSQRPLHLFGYMSVAALALGTIAGLWAVYGKLFMGLSLNRNGWFFLTFFFLLAGVIFFSFGIVIDLLMQIRFSTSKNEQRYYVREVINT